jgi:hypothetical protein
MPAKLIVSSGPGQGSEFYIEDQVVRIGSGEQCEWSLPDSHLASHAATLEFRDGGYILHNRSDDPVQLAGQDLSLRESASWSADEEADFGHGVQIRLEIDGDPAPAKAPGPVIQIEVDPEENDETKAAKGKPGSGGSGKSLQLLVIVVACALAAWMLLSDSSAENKTGGREVRFEDIIEKLKNSPTDKAREPHSFRSMLQRAHAAQLRGDGKEARAMYGSIRDALLLHPKASGGKFMDAEDDEIWRYVLQQFQAAYGDSTP